MFLFLFLPLPFFVHVVGALLNVTIDDTDSMIRYSGTWESSSSHLSGLDYGGSHTVSSDTSGSATFTFTGVAVYYLAPRWPYAVNTQLTLDGGSSIIVNLTDPKASTTAAGGSESAGFSVAWSATGLTNTSHTLVASMASTGQFIIVDGFIYTVNNGSSVSSSSSSSTYAYASKTASGTLSAASATSSVVSSTHDTLAIAVGSALGTAAIIAAALVVFFICRRRRRRLRASNVLDEWGAADPLPHPDPPTPLPFVATPTQGRYSAVPTHTLSNSDSSAGPLLGEYPAPVAWDRPAPQSQYRDSVSGPSEGSSSAYAYRDYELPPGDAYGAADDELASGSGSIARTASSRLGLGLVASGARREKGVPPRQEAYTPAPPAYSES